MQDNSRDEVEIDITDKIYTFTPFFLLYVRNITQLDLSGCQDVNANDFTQCLTSCKQLTKIILKCCSQFTELQFSLMFHELPNMTYIDLENCTELSLPTAYCILVQVQTIQMMNFMPKNPILALSDWKRLMRIFFYVHFGHSVKITMPIHSRIVQIPVGYYDEE